MNSTHNISNYNKVAIAGTHSVGKTTLVRKITEKIPHLKLIPEFAREIIDLTGLDWRSEKDINKLLEFQNLILQYQIFCHTTIECGFVADRTVFDTLTYALYHDLRLKVDDCRIYTTLLKYVNEVNLFENPPYDVILIYDLPKGYDDPAGHFIHHVLRHILKGVNCRKIAIKRGDRILYYDKVIVV